MPTRVLLVDDLRIVRGGLRALLEARGFEVVAEADDGRTAIQLSDDLSPDVVIMDVYMPGLNGIDATRRIAASTPAPKVVVLTAFLDHRVATNMLAAGAKALVPKTAAFEELTNAIDTVMDGKIYLSPSFGGDTSSAVSPSETASTNKSLTTREREVLQLIAEGKSTKEIAYHLDLSTKTIETHRRQIMEKLAIDNVADLTKYAVREGLTSLWYGHSPHALGAAASPNIN
jgi:DNA-binding NarL/FixJ family response regulator